MGDATLQAGTAVDRPGWDRGAVLAGALNRVRRYLGVGRDRPGYHRAHGQQHPAKRLMTAPPCASSMRTVQTLQVGRGGGTVQAPRRSEDRGDSRTPEAPQNCGTFGAIHMTNGHGPVQRLKRLLGSGQAGPKPTDSRGVTP